MKNDIRINHSLFLEDFDIIALNKQYPQQKIGVNVSRIYVQIAKYNQNPKRMKEIRILKNAILQTSNKYNIDAKYTVMKVCDVVVCFGKNLKKMPKCTFVSTHMFGTNN